MVIEKLSPWLRRESRAKPSVILLLILELHLHYQWSCRHLKQSSFSCPSMVSVLRDKASMFVNLQILSVLVTGL